jgi:hypothetical protein
MYYYGLLWPSMASVGYLWEKPGFADVRELMNDHPNNHCTVAGVNTGSVLS